MYCLGLSFASGLLSPCEVWSQWACYMRNVQHSSALFTYIEHKLHSAQHEFCFREHPQVKSRKQKKSLFFVSYLEFSDMHHLRQDLLLSMETFEKIELAELLTNQKDLHVQCMVEMVVNRAMF